MKKLQEIFVQFKIKYREKTNKMIINTSTLIFCLYHFIQVKKNA